MKITINQATLNNALAAVSRAMLGRNTMPVLSGIYLEATGSTLIVRATDMYMWIERRVACDVQTEGAAVIAAKALSDLVRRIPGGEVSIAVGANHHATVKWGKSEYNIPGFVAQDYPDVPALGDAETFTIGQGELKRLLVRTAFAAVQDLDKPYLSNVVLTLKGGKLTASATDNARIAHTEAAVTHSTDTLMVLAARAAGEIGRLLDDEGEAIVSFAANHAVFTIGATRVMTNRVEAKITDVLRFITFLGTVSIAVNRGELLDAIDRATGLVGKDLRFDLRSGSIRVMPFARDTGSCEEELPAGALEGDPKELALNGKFVAEYLKVLEGPEVLIECGGMIPAVRLSPVGETGSVCVLAELVKVKG